MHKKKIRKKKFCAKFIREKKKNTAKKKIRKKQCTKFIREKKNAQKIRKKKCTQNSFA